MFYFFGRYLVHIAAVLPPSRRFFLGFSQSVAGMAQWFTFEPIGRFPFPGDSLGSTAASEPGAAML
jgi:hypothetical protein